MKTVLLLVAVILMVGLAGCSKPGVKVVDEVKNDIPHYDGKPGTKIGDVRINPKDNAKMMWVPEGEFLMGSTDADKYPLRNEKPQHKVYLDGYWMYKYEVTVAQYRKFCEETNREMPDAPVWGWIDSHPIVNVKWSDATDYAKWAKASLPTEAQWEKAARGTDGRIYPWGNERDASKCNEFSKGPQKTQPVGTYPAGVSPYGCMDMAGNVWEWCADWYDEDYYYKSAPSRNPTGPADGRYRVLRGGSWAGSGVYSLRCACRIGNYPNYGYYGSGFRLAR